MKKIILLFVFTIFCTTLFSQELKRRAKFGAEIENLSDSIKNANKLNSLKGIHIKNIQKNSTSEKIGLKYGDVVYGINEKRIENINDFSAIFLELKEGDQITLNIVRNSKPKILKGIVQGAPKSTYPFADVIYDAFEFRGGLIRNILIKPKGEGKYPIIFFIQGYNCASIDNMVDFHPYEKILMELVKRGYAICKVEKPGMGDCTGTPDCMDIDFETELASFQTAYNLLSKYNFVDTNNIFIFGHSMGGFVAPLLKCNIQPRGIAVYGTVVRSWFEYFVEQSRIQNLIVGEDYKDNENAFNIRLKVNYEFFILQKPLEELMKNEDYHKLITTEWGYVEPNYVFERNYKFWQQLQNYNLINAWSSCTSNVLSIWGECDFVAFSKYDHQLIADICNKYHPGNAQFVSIPNSDHAFIYTNNLQHSSQVWGNGQYMREHFNPAIVDTLDYWIKKCLK